MENNTQDENDLDNERKLNNDESPAITQQIRALQNDFLTRRLRISYFSGLTSNGLNYIDTFPDLLSNNHNTIRSFHQFNPSQYSDLLLPPNNDNGWNDNHNDDNQKNKNNDNNNHNDHKCDGITLLLAHGFSQGLPMYSENIDAFSAIPGVNRVVAFDWIGMGGSERDLKNVPRRSPLSYFESYLHHKLDKNVQYPQSQPPSHPIPFSPPSEQTIHPTHSHVILTPAQTYARTELELSRKLYNKYMKMNTIRPSANNNNNNNSMNIVDHLHPLIDHMKNLEDALKANLTTTIQSGVSETAQYLTENIPAVPPDAVQDLTKQTGDLVSSLISAFSLTKHIEDAIYNAPNTSYTPESAVNYFIDPLLPLFDELNLLEQPVVLVGHSLGGLLSAHFIRKYPGLVQSLVLVSPVGVSPSCGLAKDSSPEIMETLLSATEMPGEGQSEPPYFFKSTMLTLFDLLWKTNLLMPQTILHNLPHSISSKISTGLAQRMHGDNICPEDKQVLADYLHLLLTEAPPVGEYALNSILHTDYPLYRYNRELQQLMFNQSDTLSPENPDATDGEEEFLKFVNQTYDVKRKMRIKSYIKEQDELKQHQERGIAPAQQSQPDETQLDTSKGDSHWQKPPHEDELSHIDVRRPSVFARAPLELFRILPTISTPVSFLYGDDDWLFGQDVPFIIRDFQRNLKQQQQLALSNASHNPQQTQQESICQYDTPSEFLKCLSMLNQVTPSSLNTSIDFVDPAIALQSTARTSGNDSAYSSTTPDYSPRIKHHQQPYSLHIIPKSGHHLYSNNSVVFNQTIKNIIQDYHRAYHHNVLERYGHYDPQYSKRLLRRYLEKNRSTLVNQHEKPAGVKNQAETSAGGLNSILTTENINNIFNIAQSTAHIITDGIFSTLHQIISQPVGTNNTNSTNNINQTGKFDHSGTATAPNSSQLTPDHFNKSYDSEYTTPKNSND